MALDIKVGDMFTETLGQKCLIVHGCNAQGVMGSGVAAIIKKQHPRAYLAYKQTQRRYGLQLGQVIIREEDEGPSIANAITQEFYGRDPRRQYVSYDAVVVAMQAVAKAVKEMDGIKGLPVHLPLIGGGLGGGDKRRLIAIFEAAFHDTDATLWIKEDEQ